MERDQATRMMQTLLKKMVAKNGSDLFITAGFPQCAVWTGQQRLLPVMQRRPRQRVRCNRARDHRSRQCP